MAPPYNRPKSAQYLPAWLGNLVVYDEKRSAETIATMTDVADVADIIVLLDRAVAQRGVNIAHDDDGYYRVMIT